MFLIAGREAAGLDALHETFVRVTPRAGRRLALPILAGGVQRVLVLGGDRRETHRARARRVAMTSEAALQLIGGIGRDGLVVAAAADPNEDRPESPSKREP